MCLGTLGQFDNQGQQSVFVHWVCLLTRPTVCLGTLDQFANQGQQCVLVRWVSLLTQAISVSWYVGSVC